jgi:tetratricopeptide (TPR) repeat protein
MDPRTHLQQAVEHHRRGELEQAEIGYRRYLTQRPGELEVVGLLGVLLGQRGDLVAGEAMLRDVLAERPDDAAVWNNLGTVMRAGEQFDEARQAFEQSLELVADDPETLANLGMTYVDLGFPEEGSQRLSRSAELRRRPPTFVLDPMPATPVPVHKLRHHLEQFDWLRGQGMLDKRFDTAVDTLAAVVAENQGRAGDQTVTPDGKLRRQLAIIWDRMVHLEPAPALAGGVLSEDLDWDAIQDAYLGSGPGMTSFDGLLRPEALASIRHYCLASTFWYQTYGDGYLGAMMRDGFGCPLLMQIAEELRLAMPRVFLDHTLREWWAFKYDSSLTGIRVHADHAAVNVNFWITPDSALLDAESGGLTVWDQEAPLDWDFRSYNNDESKMYAFIEESGAAALDVPYRQNRVVMFNSDLFHRTGEIRFAPGYENRRINITLLYGDRRKA